MIKRREETNAVRSAHNTAKLVEDNPTLVRLKELKARPSSATWTARPTRSWSCGNLGYLQWVALFCRPRTLRHSA